MGLKQLPCTRMKPCKCASPVQSARRTLLGFHQNEMWPQEAGTGTRQNRDIQFPNFNASIDFSHSLEPLISFFQFLHLQ